MKEMIEVERYRGTAQTGKTYIDPDAVCAISEVRRAGGLAGYELQLRDGSWCRASVGTVAVNFRLDSRGARSITGGHHDEQDTTPAATGEDARGEVVPEGVGD